MKTTAIKRQGVPIFALLVLGLVSACGGDDDQVPPPLTPATPLIAVVANQASNSVTASVINRSTGVLDPAAGSPFPTGGTSPGGVVVSSDGTLVHVANQGSNNVSAFTVNAGTGQLTPIGVLVPAGTTPTAATVSPDGAVHSL